MSSKVEGTRLDKLFQWSRGRFGVRGPPPIHSIKSISRRRTLARPSLVSSGHVNRTGPLCWSRPRLIMSLGCRREQTGARLKRSCVVDHARAWPTHAVRRLLILFMKALVGGWPFGQPFYREFNFSPKGMCTWPVVFGGFGPQSTELDRLATH